MGDLLHRCELKTALVYFTGFSRQIGGSEALVFLLLRELQTRYDVTLALQHTWLDPFAAAEMYGLPIDRSRINVVLLDKASGLLGKIDRHMKILWMRRLRKMGPKYDVCISCANPVDFGCPGIHFVFMLSLDNAFRAFIWKEHPKGRDWLRDKMLRFRDELARVLAGARTAASIVRDKREVVLPNSEYAKSCIEDYYRCKVHEAFYPPTLFEAKNCGIEGLKDCSIDRVENCLIDRLKDCLIDEVEAKQSKNHQIEKSINQSNQKIAKLNNRTIIQSNNLSIVSIGRLGPEKRPLEIVEIVRNARNRSGLDFKLRLVGHCSNAYLSKRLAELTAENAWLRVDDAIVGDAKAELLASCTFALHACKVEAFGISITEYLKAGLVPVVPREGGSSEVVGLDKLAFETDDDAAEILIRLATETTFYDKCLKHCKERGKVFTAEAYLGRQRRLLKVLKV